MGDRILRVVLTPFTAATVSALRGCFRLSAADAERARERLEKQRAELEALAAHAKKTLQPLRKETP
jgi:hypothetical protein